MADVTVTDFRALLPEFASTAVYPDATVTAWLGIANATLDECRWNAFYPLGVCNFVAHFLVLGQRNAKAAATGGIPGASGLVNQKTVGRVAVGNDTMSVSMKDAGPWNLTTYGTQFLWFAQMVGAGGVQITGPILIDPDFAGAGFGVM